VAKNKSNKGIYLELRVARLLFAQGLSPFVNVWFRSGLDLSSISQPDVDVLGCLFLPDCTRFSAYYDCKSGESKVVNRVLLLSGLKEQLPPGPITYVRKNTSLDVKQYAMQHGIRITDIRQIEEKEKQFVKPVFGNSFPSICDRDVHELWLSIKGKYKKEGLGKILNYLEYEFWSESTFTRLKRSLAAVQLSYNASTDVGLSVFDQDIIISLIIRKFVFSLLDAASNISLLSDTEILELIKKSIITEKLSLTEYYSLIESTAQLIFELYGDSAKGPLRKEDYYVPPPDYTEELTGLLRKTVNLHHALPHAIAGFDAFIIENAVRKRQNVADAILRPMSKKQAENLKVWLRSIKLFLSSYEDSLSNWNGWESLAES